MEAKQLYKKHLNIHLDWHKDKYLSSKQLEVIKYEASIDAIEEALNLKNNNYEHSSKINR